MTPKRVLIIRLSAIGDVVFASPLINACRQTHPDATIDWLCEPIAAPLLSGHPNLNEIIIWPRADWSRLWSSGRWWSLGKQILRFRRRLRANQYDLVLDVQGLLKSSFLAGLTGAAHRIGFRSKEPTGFWLTRRIGKDTGPRISSEYRGMAEALDWDTSQFEMTVMPSEEDCERAAAIADSPFVVLCPFTTRPQKHWTIAHWRHLVELLLTRGENVCVLGGPADREEADKLLEGFSVHDAVGRYSLGVSAALVGHARALIGVDTGLTHMGIAHDVPTVVLFGSTCPYLETLRDNVEVIYHALDCSPCRRNPTCHGAFTCMTGIVAEEVITSLERVLPNKRIVATDA